MVDLKNLTAYEDELETGKVIADGGSAAAPSYTFLGNLDTGMTSLSPDVLSLITAGAERLRIDSAGNVGVGIATPTNYGAGTQSISVAGSTGSGYVDIYNAGLRKGLLYSDGSGLRLDTSTGNSLLFGTENVERMRVDTAGNVGIGISTPSVKLEVISSSDTLARFSSTAGASSLNFTDNAGATGGLVSLGSIGNNLRFITNAQEKMRINAAGTLLVGTSVEDGITTVGHQLNASGFAAHARDSGVVFQLDRKTSDGAIIEFFKDTVVTGHIGNEAGGALEIQSTNAMQFDVGGAVRATIDASGNVGVGTVIPTHRLHLRDTDGDILHLDNTTTVDSNIKFTNSLGNWNIGTFSNDAGVTDSFRLRDSTANTDRLVINASGNVGIGTSTPTARLDLEESGASLVDMLHGNNESSAGGARAIFFSAGESITIEKFGPTFTPSGVRQASSSLIQANGAGGMWINSANAAGSIILATGGSATTNERMRIDASGNVVIGTSTPLAATKTTIQSSSIIQIGGTDTANATWRIGTPSLSLIGIGGNSNHSVSLGYYDTGNTTFTSRLLVEATTGNVGIGTASPLSKFHLVNTTASATARIQSTVGGAYFQLDGANGFNSIQYNLSNSGHFSLYDITASSERLRIDSAGNVGIGTSTPSAKLSVTTSSSDGNVTSWSSGQLVVSPGGTSTSAGIGFSVDTANSNAIISALTPATSWNNLILRSASTTIFYGNGTTEGIKLNTAGRVDIAGNVHIGTNSPDVTSALEVASTTKGFLPPRMTTTQRDAISSPAAGLIVYNSTTNKHQGYNGTTWNDFY